MVNERVDSVLIDPIDELEARSIQEGLKPGNKSVFERELARLRQLRQSGQLPSVQDDIQLRALAAINTFTKAQGEEQQTDSSPSCRGGRPISPQRPMIESLIGELKKRGEKIRPSQIAAEFGISAKTVSRILTKCQG